MACGEQAVAPGISHVQGVHLAVSTLPIYKFLGVRGVCMACREQAVTPGISHVQGVHLAVSTLLIYKFLGVRGPCRARQ